MYYTNKCLRKSKKSIFLTAVIMCCINVCTICAQSSDKANLQNHDPRYSININKASLSEFVKKVERVTDYSFIYSEEVEKQWTVITINELDVSIQKLLEQVFLKQAIGYEVIGGHILLSLKKEANQSVPKFTISGYLTDERSSETLLGATVFEHKKRKGATTNSFGFYSITLPQGEVEMSYSYIGYEMKKMEFFLSKDTIINIRLNSNTELAEVVVLSTKNEVGINSPTMGTHEISNTQIQRTPVLLGEADILKTIQLSPGVQAGIEGLSGLYVRGGGPDENLILLDGIPIYNADHLLGVFSVFTPEAVKKVTLYKSAFPARYGGRLSSIVDVQTKNGDMYKYHGTVSIGTLTSKVHFEGPIVKDKTSFIINMRGTHTVFVKAFKSDDDSYDYYFYDLNAKINHKFNDRNRLFLNFYQGRDSYNYEYNEKRTLLVDQVKPENIYRYKDKTDINWGTTILAARWNCVFNHKVFSNTTVAYNNYRMVLKGGANEHNSEDLHDYFYHFNTKFRSGIRDLSFRSDFEYSPMPSHSIRFGVEYLYHTFTPETSSSKVKEQTGSTIEQDTVYAGIGDSYLKGHEITAYIEDNFELSKRLNANLGVNLSLFHTQGKSYIYAQPRASLRYDLTKGYAIKASYSQMVQYVHLLASNNIPLPTDLWVPITKNIRPMFSNQYSVGAYYNGFQGWEFSVEGYYKQMNNILEYQDGVSFFGSSTHWEEKVESGTGRSMGAEFMLQKTGGKTTGWLAYTLAKSDRIFKEGTINNGKRFPYKYDCRHSISLCVNHDFNQRIDVGATWTLNSGGTITVPEIQTVVIKPNGELMQESYISKRNNYRLPISHRLNIGVNFNKKTKHGIRTWNISVYNAYNAMNPNFVYSDRKNDKEVEYNPSPGANLTVEPQRRGKVIIKKFTLLPCIPSFTYTYRF